MTRYWPENPMKKVQTTDDGRKYYEYTCQYCRTMFVAVWSPTDRKYHMQYQSNKFIARNLAHLQTLTLRVLMEYHKCGLRAV